MAKFDKENPGEARISQDVNPIVRRDGSNGPISTGRGGGGNLVREGSENTGKKSSSKDRDGSNRRTSMERVRRSSNSFVEKGREILQKARSASGTRKESP